MSIYLTPGNWRMRRMLTSGHAGLLQQPRDLLSCQDLSALSAENDCCGRRLPEPGNLKGFTLTMECTNISSGHNHLFLLCVKKHFGPIVSKVATVILFY